MGGVLAGGRRREEEMGDQWKVVELLANQAAQSLAKLNMEQQLGTSKWSLCCI